MPALCVGFTCCGVVLGRTFQQISIAHASCLGCSGLVVNTLLNLNKKV